MSTKNTTSEEEAEQVAETSSEVRKPVMQAYLGSHERYETLYKKLAQ